MSGSPYSYTYDTVGKKSIGASINKVKIGIGIFEKINITKGMNYDI